MYLRLFVNTLLEEFDVSTNPIDWDHDTVEELVSNLRQVEIRKGLRTATEGSVRATLAHCVKGLISSFKWFYWTYEV
jgi:hypothetical protein